MTISFGFFAGIGLIFAILNSRAEAQNLPSPLSFSVSGAFENGVGQTSSSLLITDNNLTDGYTTGMDLHDAPAGLGTEGPAGSAAFQWGDAATSGTNKKDSSLDRGCCGFGLR